MYKLLLFIPVALIVLFLRFCINSIKKQWIDKKGISVGDQVVAQNILKDFQNSDKQSAMEHVIYMEDDEIENNLNSELEE